ncbi:hypothetical protein JCM10213v2_007096 [Rhodosporidiobolus nylandii]
MHPTPPLDHRRSLPSSPSSRPISYNQEQWSSPYPPLSSSSTPIARSQPSLSRSTTYLASLGPSPPMASAPPFRGTFSDEFYGSGSAGGEGGHEWREAGLRHSQSLGPAAVRHRPAPAFSASSAFPSRSSASAQSNLLLRAAFSLHGSRSLAPHAFLAVLAGGDVDALALAVRRTSADSPFGSLEETEQEELARTRRASLASESARQARHHADEERRLALTLEASAQERLRADALAAQRAQAEEAALRDAMQRSREEEERRRLVEEEEVLRAIRESEAARKGKGKARADEESSEDEWSRADREAVELAMRLSLQDGGRGGSRAAETSAQAFERFSRPGPAPPARSSSASHPLFVAATSPPSASTAVLSTSPPNASTSSAFASSHRRQLSEEFPPAYEYPLHAAELDSPGDVILGPGRPLPSLPYRSATSSSAPHPPPGAAPATYHSRPAVPPSRSTSTSSFASVPQHPLFGSPASSVLAFPPTGEYAPSSVYDSVIGSAGSYNEAGSRVASLTATPAPERDEGQAEDPFGDAFSIELSRDDSGGAEQEEVVEEQELGLPAKDLFGIWRRRASSSASRGERPRDVSSLSVAGNGEGEGQPSLTVVVDAGTEPPSRPSSSPTSTSENGGGSTEVTPIAGSGGSLPTPLTAPAAATSSSPPISPPLLSPPPSASTAATSLSPSPSSPPSTSPPLPSPASFYSAPSSGGLVSEPTSQAAPFAREDVLHGVRWGFVDPVKAPMHPPLEFEGDFPRGAQMSLTQEEGKEAYRCFAVEAGGWQGLLVFLMWHGNSRLEAAPSDLELDKLNRGLTASLSLDFFRSFASHQPRIRATLTLQPLSSSSRSVAVAEGAAATPLEPPTFDVDCPSVRLALPHPLQLPLALSQLASSLSHAHSTSRASLRLLKRGVVGGSSSSSATAILSERATLARAVELLKRLNGEKTLDEAAAGRSAEDAEVGLLDRMKARLRARGSRKVRVLESAEGRGRQGPLPEGAMLITPFALD